MGSNGVVLPHCCSSPWALFPLWGAWLPRPLLPCREKVKKKGEREGRKRKHSHRGRRRRREEESETESSSDEDIGSGSSESETESSSSSSSSEEERQRRRKKKMKKRRRSSDSKHKSKPKKERKRLKSHKKSHKIKNFEEISVEDYFRKSVEFRSWLSEERKKFFSDLTSQESHLLFKDFVKEWNDQLLHKKYYRGLQSAALEHGKQTGHVWKFSSSLGKKELSGVMKDVSSWTAGDDAELGGAGGGASQIGPHLPAAPSTSGAPTIGPTIGPIIGPIIGPTLPGGSVAMATDSDPHLAEQRWRGEQEKVRLGRREMRKQQDLVMEELLPKATGKEARFEKKRMRAEKRRDREISPDVAESNLMGPKVDIHRKIQNRQAQRHNRAQAAAEKVAEIRAKEKSKMQALMEMARANKKEGAMW